MEKLDLLYEGKAKRVTKQMIHATTSLNTKMKPQHLMVRRKA